MKTTVTTSRENLTLRKTEDFRAMRELALRSGLEESVLEDFDVAYGCYKGRRLVGCVGLRKKVGVFTIECLAVAEDLQGKGIGRTLIGLIEDEARKMGAKDLWAVARAPGFFERIGYTVAKPPPGQGPTLKGCASCRQFGRSCHPAIVFRAL